MKNVIVLFFLLLSHLGFAQRAVPPLWGHRVHDEAHVLSTSSVEELEAMLKQHEDSTSNQIAVLIIPSLEGEILEEYALRVADKEWKLGKETKDNGVLLLIAVEDRKMRIEVGEGLEGVLPDVICNRIIRNEMAPHFRDQDYEGGVKAALVAIIRAIKGEYVVDESDEAGAEMSWKERTLVGVIVFGMLGVFTFIGLFANGCVGWVLFAFLIPFYGAFPMVVFGPNGGVSTLLAYLIGFPILKLLLGRTAWGKKMATKMTSTRSGGGGWSSGGGAWSSGSRGGWSSGGGGFSGGGGSFGGGGSSGSW